MLWAGFEPAQNLSSGCIEWSCAIVITATSWCHLIPIHWKLFHLIELSNWVIFSNFFWFSISLRFIYIVMWYCYDCNGTLTHNHLVCKQTFNHLAKMAKWFSCVVSTHLYSAFDCMFLSCYVGISELIHTL